MTNKEFFDKDYYERERIVMRWINSGYSAASIAKLFGVTEKLVAYEIAKFKAHHGLEKDSQTKVILPDLPLCEVSYA
jgi:transposase-like protein